MAQHAVKYRKQHEDACAALQALGKSTPWKVGLELGACDPEGVREHWRKEYGTVVDVIATSETALREAAIREANGLAPSRIVAGGNKSVKTGYRDAAVWMSAIEYARAHPDEVVYFVSSNTKDFGDGSIYDYPMDQDLDGLEERFVHLTSFDQVVSRFSQPAQISLKRVQEILDRPASLEFISDEAVSQRDMTIALDSQGFECTVEVGGLSDRTSTAWAIGWISPLMEAKFHSLKDVNAYRIGEHEWCTVTVRWHLGGPALLSGEDRFAAAGCSWETRILLTPQDDDPRLVVLRSSVPQALEEHDFRDLSPNTKFTRGMLRAAMRKIISQRGESVDSARVIQNLLSPRKPSDGQGLEGLLMRALLDHADERLGPAM